MKHAVEQIIYSARVGGALGVSGESAGELAAGQRAQIEQIYNMQDNIVKAQRFGLYARQLKRDVLSLTYAAPDRRGQRGVSVLHALLIAREDMDEIALLAPLPASMHEIMEVETLPRDRAGRDVLPRVKAADFARGAQARLMAAMDATRALFSRYQDASARLERLIRRLADMADQRANPERRGELPLRLFVVLPASYTGGALPLRDMMETLLSLLPAACAGSISYLAHVTLRALRARQQYDYEQYDVILTTDADGIEQGGSIRDNAVLRLADAPEPAQADPFSAFVAEAILRGDAESLARLRAMILSMPDARAGLARALNLACAAVRAADLPELLRLSDPPARSLLWSLLQATSAEAEGAWSAWLRARAPDLLERIWPLIEADLASVRQFGAFYQGAIAPSARAGTSFGQRCLDALAQLILSGRVPLTLFGQEGPDRPLVERVGALLEAERFSEASAAARECVLKAFFDDYGCAQLVWRAFDAGGLGEEERLAVIRACQAQDADARRVEDGAAHLAARYPELSGALRGALRGEFRTRVVSRAVELGAIPPGAGESARDVLEAFAHLPPLDQALPALAGWAAASLPALDEADLSKVLAKASSLLPGAEDALDKLLTACAAPDPGLAGPLADLAGQLGDDAPLLRAVRARMGNEALSAYWARRTRALADDPLRLVGVWHKLFAASAPGLQAEADAAIAERVAEAARLWALGNAGDAARLERHYFDGMRAMLLRGARAGRPALNEAVSAIDGALFEQFRREPSPCFRAPTAAAAMFEAASLAKDPLCTALHLALELEQALRELNFRRFRDARALWMDATEAGNQYANFIQSRVEELSQAFVPGARAEGGEPDADEQQALDRLLLAGSVARMRFDGKRWIYAPQAFLDWADARSAGLAKRLRRRAWRLREQVERHRRVDPYILDALLSHSGRLPEARLRAGRMDYRLRGGSILPSRAAYALAGLCGLCAALLLLALLL